ncbi:type IV pilus twitching motility protein PilT [Acetobacter sp.]|uniref:type IV pilus twitching motility protein PilT n=1 Tax=Acetobacter sp. TaxID=440 RepID=UPI0039E89A4F
MSASLEPNVVAFDGWPHEGRRAYPWVAEARKSAPGLDDLLQWAHAQGASRIDFKSGHRTTIKVHGVGRYVTAAPMKPQFVDDIVRHVYGNDGPANIQVNKQIDTAYSVMQTRTDSLRFRLNICPIMTLQGQGTHIVMRPIPSKPPSLDVQLVEDEIRATNDLPSGMVFVGGATGSGKSTLQFGLAQAKLLDPRYSCDMATGEEPIEFLLDYLKPDHGSRISQTEIRPPNMTFASFVRGCMRREMTDLIVGECRDGDTMDAAINCAITGGKLMTTVHADDVPLMIQRAISLCPRAERDNLVSALAQSLRFVMNQRLLPRKGGGRVAIREFVTFDRALRRRLLTQDADTWPDLIRQAVDHDGQSFATAIRLRLEQDLITEETALLAEKRDA